MANVFYDRRRIIFFLDCRGSNLEYEMNRINYEKKQVEPWMFKSATIKDLVKEATNYGRTRPYDMLFVEGGFCDITTKNKSRLNGKILKNSQIIS